MKQLDSSTARLMVSICRQHMDRACNSGIPDHLQYELAAIIQAPAGEIEPAIKSDALALLKECRGAL